MNTTHHLSVFALAVEQEKHPAVRHVLGLNPWKTMNNTTYNYMAGHCHVMAIALNTLHPEWQMRAHVGWDEEAEDDDDYRVDHVYLVAPDGAAYDCRGCFVSEEALVGDHLIDFETQCVDFDLAEIQRLVQRGELKPFTRQDVDTTIAGFGEA